MNLIRWLTTALCMLGAASPLCAGSQPQGPEARESAVCAEPAARTELRVVYSEDGLEFIGLGERFVVHAAAPDLIRLPGELLALFDCAVRPDKENETVLAVSRSEDDGESWSAVKPIVLSGSDSRTTTAMRAVHGDLLRTRGRYLRLFFSAATRSEPGRPGGGPRGRTVIRSAVTRDGLHYRLDPAVRIRAVDRSGAADPHPTAVRVGGQIHLYLATLARPENDAAARAATAEHVISRDGRRFARIAPAQTPDANFVGSVVSFAGGLRAYVSSRAGIRSATSRDGRIWRVEPGVRVTDGWDPAVVRLEDGSFMMVYCAALEDGTTAPSVRTQGSPGQHRAARAGGAAGDERYARRRRDAVGDDVLAVGESEYDTWYREMSEYSLVPLADEEELTLVAGGSPGDPIVQGIPLEGFDMDASGEAWGMTEFDDGFPARPDFNTPVDYVQWYEDLAAGEAKPGENAFDVYEAFIPGVGPDPAGAVEWPELKNMFSDENCSPASGMHPCARDTSSYRFFPKRGPTVRPRTNRC